MSKNLLVLLLIVNTLFTSSAYCIGLSRLDFVSAQRGAGILAISSGLFALFSGIHHEYLQDRARKEEASQSFSTVTPAEIKGWGIALFASTLTFNASIIFFLVSKNCSNLFSKTAAPSPV